MAVMRLLIVLAVALPLAGCFTLGAGGLCALGPVRPQPGDRFTRKTAERIVAENETGEQVCGWKP